MDVTRRTFIKTIAAGTFAISSGVGLSDLVRPRHKYLAINSEWVIDILNKKIIHARGNTVWPMQQMHRQLVDYFDTPRMIEYEMPTVRNTDTVFQLINGWRIPDDDFRYINGGSVSDDFGNVWSNFYSVGFATDETKIKIVQGDEKVLESKGLITDDIDVLIKTCKDSSLINDGKITVSCKHSYRNYYDWQTHAPGASRIAFPVY